MVSKSYDILGRVVVFVGPSFSAFIMEFIGTFFLVATIGFVSVAGESPNSTSGITGGLAIGSILMVMVFMGGHVSGAHYNPSVTLGVRLTGRDHITTRNATVYLLVQLLGGFVAALYTYSITDKTWAPVPSVASGKAMVIEMFHTFALVSVMLNCATTKSQSMNSFFGLAIGFTVLSGAYSVGGLSGGVFNPAVATGPIIVDLAFGKGESGKYIWVYWIGPILGSFLAAVVFRVTNTAEYRKESAVAAPTTNTSKKYAKLDNEDDRLINA